MMQVRGEGNMQVGDLVELSAAANKIQLLSRYNGKHGIVIKQHVYAGYTVQWFGVEAYRWQNRNGRKRHSRRELKYLKKRGDK